MQFKFWRTVKGPNGPLKVPFWKRTYLLKAWNGCFLRIPVDATEVYFNDAGLCTGWDGGSRPIMSGRAFKKFRQSIKNSLIEYLRS